MRFRFLIHVLVAAVVACVATLLPGVALVACRPGDLQKGARFAVDLLDVSCSFLEADPSEPEWLVYACQAVDVGGAMLGGPAPKNAPAPAPARVRVRVHKRDAAAFERATRSEAAP